MERYNKSQMEGTSKGTGYMDMPQKYFQNYFRYVTDYVKEYTDFDFPEGGETLKRNIQAINRCFYSNTVEEIIDNLKRENSPFAKKCLEQMERNSMLSMKLSLKMMR
jgi:hypothetical protein